MPLDTSLPISGTVTDDQGNPREGAEVRVYRLDTEDTNSDGEPDNITGSTFLARQQTDVNGDFSFSDSLPATYNAGQSEEIEYVAVVAHGLDSGSGEPLDNGRFPVLDASNESNATVYVAAYSKEVNAPPDNATFRVSVKEETGFSDGDRITTLTDQIGTRDLTDGTGLDYVASAINGFPAASSDGVDDILGISNWGSSIPQPVTFSGVFQQKDDIGILFGLREDNDGPVAFNGGGDFTFFAGTSLNDGAGDLDPHTFVIVYDGANSILNIDGTEYTGNAGNRLLNNGVYLSIGGLNPDSGSNFSDAYHGEFVLIPERLDSTQRDNEITRLKDEWGIA